jgi:hypothetical protein
MSRARVRCSENGTFRFYNRKNGLCPFLQNVKKRDTSVTSARVRLSSFFKKRENPFLEL